MSEEQHLLLVWSNGSNQLHRIRNHIPTWARIDTEVRVHWGSRSEFRRNLAGLYGPRPTDLARKIRHCGDGPFTAFVVTVTDPVYDLRRTSRGERRVNTATFDAKQRYRAWTGGGSRVHASDDTTEAFRDISYILSGPQLATEIISSTTECDWHGAPWGRDGWATLHDALTFLHLTTQYVIIRNFENLESLGPRSDELHPDVDLLVEDRRAAAAALGGCRRPRRPGRARWLLKVGDGTVGVDLRTPDDGYFPASWARSALKNRIELPNHLYVPNPEDHLRLLRYHAHVHKTQVAADYKARLGDEDDSLGILIDDLTRSGERVTLPNDPSVRCNPIMGPVPGLRIRNAATGVWNLTKAALGRK